MPEIKEKPKAGKPKGRRKSAGPPRQAGRLMKEKLVREVDQRKEREAENGSYAVDQVEQAGVQGADEFIQALRPNHKRKSGAGNTQSAKENRDGRPEREVPPQGQPTSAPKERRPVEGQRPQRQGTVPRERSPGGQQAVPIRERPRMAAKERGRGKALQGQARPDALPTEAPSAKAGREPARGPRSAAYRGEARPSEGRRSGPGVWRPGEDVRRPVMGGATPKTGAPGTKGRAAPLPGGKAPLGPKVRGAEKPARRFVQAFQKPAQAARQSAQRRLAQQAARTAKGAAELGRRLTAAVVRAVAAMMGSLIGLAGGAVVLIVLVVVVLIAAIAMAITNLSTDALLKRMKPQTLMTVGMILCGVCYVLMGAAPCQATYFLGGVGYGASMGFSYPVLTVMAVNGVPERRRGAATSTMLMAGDVGVGVGTFLWGAIIDGAGFTVSFLLAGISVVLGGVFSCLFYLGRKK